MASAITSRTKVMLVDDSKVMRGAAQKMLSGEFDVVTAEDGEEAWQQLQADSDIQVVFTDLSMPNVDGYELLQKIRAAEDAGIHNMPVIVVTGAENDDAARERALDLGATDFITKPFNSTDLLERARANANYQRVARKLQQQVTVDPLTGLANKAAFMDRLQQDISFATRHQQPHGIVRLEIDGFKKLFLRYGKAVADSVILHVAGVVSARVRKEDEFARIGLASFALSSPAGSPEGLRILAARIKAAVGAGTLQADGKPLRITLSAGVHTPLPRPETTAAGAMEACQRILEAAIAAGGDTVLTDAASGAGKAEPSRPAAEPALASVRIDALLEQLARGERREVVGQLPHALKRLSPLLRLLNKRQRTQLIQFLQSIGDPVER